MRTVENIKCSGDREALLRFLLVKAAPVMLKVRPAVLIRLSNCGRIAELRRYDHFCIHQQEILSALRTNYLILKNTGKDMQILFFDSEGLETVLTHRDNCEFLEGIGYRRSTEAGEYLAELRRRFVSPLFPHEIGIFLGYPLKDVRAFMAGRQDSVSIPRPLWRVFDDPSESLRLMWMYRFAEDIGRAAIVQYKQAELSIEQIRKCVCNKVAVSSV